MAELLRETRNANGYEYTEVWHITPPEPGQKYRVLRDEWNLVDDGGKLDERHIYEIERTLHLSSG